MKWMIVWSVQRKRTEPPLRGTDALDAARQTQDLAQQFAEAAAREVEIAKQHMRETARNVSKTVAEKVVANIEHEL